MAMVCKDLPGTIVQTGTDSESREEEKPVIACALCRSYVTEPEFKILMKETHTHVFANPHGLVFEIGCFSSAAGCIPASDASDEFSWFPGFAWQIGICRQCGSHLGWIFNSGDERFFGLILDKLIIP